MNKSQQRLIHRRTFQNANQVVELTVRTIPKSAPSSPPQLLPPPPPPPLQLSKKCCSGTNKISARVNRDISKASKVTVNVYQKRREDDIRSRKEVQRRGKAAMVPEEERKENEGVREEYRRRTPEEEGNKDGKEGIDENGPDFSYSSSSSSRSHLRNKRKEITKEFNTVTTRPSSHLSPVSEHSTPRPLSLSQALSASPVPPPPPATTTTTTTTTIHPNQVPNSVPLLSDDTTPSPFGNSAIVYLRRLRQLLEDRGLGEEGAFLGVIEAFISTPGSGDIIREAPSLPTPTPTITPINETTTATLHSLQHNSNKLEVEKLKKIIEEKDGVINELRTLSSNLIIQQEMMLEKTGEASRDKREGRETEIGEKEEIKREAEKFKEESEKLRQEKNKLREHIVNLEIQLTRTSRLLEIERRKSTFTTTSTTAHNPTITTTDSTTKRPTLTSEVQESPNSQQNQTDQLCGASARSHNLNPQINIQSYTRPHELIKPTRLPPSLNESEIDSAYERTPSHITSKASTPPVSLLQTGVNLASNRSGEDVGKIEGVLGRNTDNSSGGGGGSRVEERGISVGSTIKEYQRHLSPPPPPPSSLSLTQQNQPQSSKTSTHLYVNNSTRREKHQKIGSSEVRLRDHIQRWISQSSMNLSSPSTLDEAEVDLISSLSTQESSFFQGIVSNRCNVNTPQNELPQILESGTHDVMESTRVSGSNSNTKFERLEPGTLSTEDLKKCVQLLD